MIWHEDSQIQIYCAAYPRKETKSCRCIVTRTRKTTVFNWFTEWGRRRCSCVYHWDRSFCHSRSDDQKKARNTEKDGSSRGNRNVQSCSPLYHNQGSMELVPYWEHRHDLWIIDNLLLLGDRIIILRSLCSYMLEKLHGGHLGIKKSKRRAYQHVYWPKMDENIKKIVKQCKVYATLLPFQPSATLLPQLFRLNHGKR